WRNRSARFPTADLPSACRRRPTRASRTWRPAHRTQASRPSSCRPARGLRRTGSLRPRYGRRSCLDLLRQGGAQGVGPVLVLDRVQPLVFGANARAAGVQAERPGLLVRAFDPVGRAATHVVPAHRPALIALLAGPEFLQIIRRRHAAGVEEIFILPDAVGAF